MPFGFTGTIFTASSFALSAVMLRKNRKTLARTSKGTGQSANKTARARWRTHVRKVAAGPSGPVVPVPSLSPGRNMSGFVGASAHYPRSSRAFRTGGLSRCHVCKLPSVLLELKRVKTPYGRMGTECIPAQGPSTHPLVMRWCGGSCMAILCVLGSTYADLEVASKEMKETRKFWKLVQKMFRWMTHEVKRDLALKSRDFYGVKP